MPGTINIFQQICSRDNIKIITSIPYFLLSLSEQDYITVSFWCLPQRFSLSVREFSIFSFFFFWCPWKFGFKRMQHPSSILPWWLCTAIHIKNAGRLLRKCSAHPSKWKCISIAAALFLLCVWHSIHLDGPPPSASLDRLFPSKLSRLLFTQHF